MAWTTPKTNWKTGELVTAEQMNAIGENLAALRHPSTAVAVHTTTANLTVSASTDYVDVDSENLNLRLSTRGGYVLVHFQGRIRHGGLKLDVAVDGNRVGDSSHGVKHSGADYQFVSFTYLVEGLSAGDHTFKLQGKYGAATTIYTGAQFWVREI